MDKHHDNGKAVAPVEETSSTNVNARRARRPPSRMNPVARLAYFGGIIENVLDTPEILAVLATWETDVGAIQALLHESWDLISEQKAGLGDKRHAQEVFDDLRDRANDIYMAAYTVADVLIENPDHREALVLAGPRKESYAGWLGQVVPFFENALAEKDIIDILSLFVSKKKVQEGKDLLARAISAEYARDKGSGASKMTTAERDALVYRLSRQMKAFIRVLQSALVAQPELAALVGVKVRQPTRNSEAVAYPFRDWIYHEG